MDGIQITGYSPPDCHGSRSTTVVVPPSRCPFFCRPLTGLFNLYSNIVPNQWKAAYIRPVPKVTTTESHNDFRPISITPVLSTMMEKTVNSTTIHLPVSKQPTTDLGFFVTNSHSGHLGQQQLHCNVM